MKKQNFKKALPYLIITFFFVGSVAVIAGVTGGVTKRNLYRSNSNEIKKVIDYENMLRVVHNSSTKDYFIPNNSSDEWNSFENNLPSNVWLDVVSCDDVDFICGSECSYQEKIYGTEIKGNGSCWFTENLAVTDYPNNAPINLFTDMNQIVDANGYVLSSVHNTIVNRNNAFCPDNYCLYQTLAATNNVEPLPSTSTVKIRGICPAGWHIPSMTEWKNNSSVSFSNCSTQSSYNTDICTGYNSSFSNQLYGFVDIYPKQPGGELLGDRVNLSTAAYFLSASYDEKTCTQYYQGQCLGWIYYPSDNRVVVFPGSGYSVWNYGVDNSFASVRCVKD